MNRKSMVTVWIAAWLAVLCGLAISAQDKYSAKVPGGLATSEFAPARTVAPARAPAHPGRSRR